MDAALALADQADACGRLGSPMYADLLARCAEDVTAAGVVAEVLRGHEDDPGPSALALRLLGSVHRLVLERRAGALAAFYPSVGGRWDLEGAWPAFTALLAEEAEAVRSWLDRAPQTNEVGRSAALYGGLLHLPRDLPVRLTEIGSSAGLNLRLDRYAYTDAAGREFGTPSSRVRLADAWTGHPLQPWPDLRVLARAGSDLHPVDPTSTQGRLALTAYVWPDQVARLERLRGALEVAAAHPAEVRRASAAEVADGLHLAEGATTVLMHSVMWQYLDPAEQSHVLRRLDELGAGATRDRRLAHLRAEPGRRHPGGELEFLVSLRTWPDGEDRVLGTTAAHGVPTEWRQQ